MHETIKDVRDTLIDQLMEQVEKAVDRANESLEKAATRVEQLKDVQQSYNDILNDTIDTQKDLESELQANMDSYQYLDETMRQLMFNEDDYKKLSKVLSGIQEDIASIWQDHYDQIANLSEDEMYKAEYITQETQRQLAAKQKEYEIARAELEVAKAKTNLENVKNERNTRMFINGEWKWVADPNAVKDAQKQLADAEREQERLEREQAQQVLIDDLDRIIDSDNLQIDKNNEVLGQINESIENATKEVKSIDEALANIKDANLPELNTTLVNAFGSDGGTLKELFGEISQGQKELVLALKGMTVSQAEDKLKSGKLGEKEFRDLVKQLGYSFNDKTGKVTTQEGSFSAHYSGWKAETEKQPTTTTADNGVQVTGNKPSGSSSGSSNNSNKNTSSNKNSGYPKTGKVTPAIGLNIRSGAGMNYRILGAMPKGAKVTVLSDAGNGWVKVKYNNIQGYSSKQYLAFDKGGIANGLGFLSKQTIKPERILSPRQTKAFENLVGNITSNPVLNALSKVPSVSSNLLGKDKNTTENGKNYYFSNFTVQANDIKEFINSIETIIPMQNK